MDEIIGNKVRYCYNFCFDYRLEDRFDVKVVLFGGGEIIYECVLLSFGRYGFDG